MLKPSMADNLLKSWVPGVIAWVVIYVSDYYCTIASARLYQETIKAHLEFEGSFELNPVFRADIDRLRWVSPRFIVLLTLTSLMLVLYWYLSQFAPYLAFAYPALLGSFLLMECAIHMRHARSLYQFRGIRRGGMTGQCFYKRGFVLRNTAFEMLSFGVLFLVIGMLQRSWFFAGGTFACTLTALKHWVLARKHERAHAT